VLGLSAAGWLVGLGCLAVLYVSVTRGLSAYRHTPGPADLVTMVRATLTCGVAALVADSFVGDAAQTTLVVLAAVALALDAVDGPLARMTGTTSAFGGKFDGEADAFLMLVLSVYVASVVGVWVLAIGLLRYAFGAAALVLPWMRERLPYRYWRKVVTAVAGIALTVAAAGVVPTWVTTGTLVVVLATLAESFGRDVRWLWRHRSEVAEAPALLVGEP
jgi:phosphatidylglycerophosphate synthase